MFSSKQIVVIFFELCIKRTVMILQNINNETPF